MDAHNAIVTKVSERVKHFHSLQQPFRIYHGSTNSTRQSHRNADNTVDTSKLTNILSIDKERSTAIVEPNVPLDALLDETLKVGLMPPVVMELPGITVGGGFSGTSGESSSFRYGAFDSTVESIEIVLADGTISKASRTEKPDLFWGAASAFGTVGVVTLVEVRLKPAKKYVALTYSLSKSATEYCQKFREEIDKNEIDFLDGISYATDSTVVCSGVLVDEIPDGQKQITFSQPSDPWFYLRAQDVQKPLKEGKAVVDYVPIKDYLFRFDRGGFWTARYAFKYFMTPFNSVTRRALNRFMHTRDMFRAMHKSGIQDFHVIQDVGVPFDRAPEFHQWLDDQLSMYPIWLCPLRVRRDDPDSGHGLHAEFADPATTPELLNYGVWGPVDGTRRDAMEANRRLEHKVQDFGGKKWLYGQAYYTEEEFWAHYNRGPYDAVREKYGAGYLPNVYDKVKVDFEAEEAARNETAVKSRLYKSKRLMGLYGVYHAYKGGDYLMKKEKPAKTQPVEEKKAEEKVEKKKAEETKAEEQKTEENKAEENKAVEKKVDETTPVETKAVETKPEESKPEEKKVE
ncbi:unnamed protein product [Clonostachys rhizophaga]|uniref:Delta(24)-sterol reductase n=1 Tax=Clonostachys rhizophaga TaxID=160324 RepID=A0A9N9YDT0_9HYPO|nr:unnamed protein product [Clonostachys rhizophaga]